MSKNVEKQAITDEFIELESPLMVANSLKLTDNKKVLKEHNLKVSCKKEELIQRFGEGLTEDELNSYFKGEKYRITDKGLEICKHNNYIIYIHKNSEVSEVIFPSEYVDIFDERYPQIEIDVTLIDYFNGKFVNQLNE
ncbi:MAG: SAP domain-containing protein [Methanobrevibacter sp.]|uniref:SAP domain-containing protein n=1 Tax=Methanobrevibacter sp. TaxID=66852 RepID=UPI0025F888F6|nr:SAP domain-containing protein [Methanobrevibacter sp.]MBR6993926.1 SAP domain-containing protein [Methanobrevibacter sp.]